MPNKIDLSTKRMDGNIDPYFEKVNMLFGLDRLCQKYLDNTKTVLELGSYHGVSTRLLAYYAKTVTAVDMYYPPIMLKICNEYNNINFIHGDIYHVVPSLTEKYDFIYIDAMHSHQSVVRDIHMCLPLIQKNGHIGGHDYDVVAKNGVYLAVNEIFGESVVEYFEDQSWVVKI